LTCQRLVLSGIEAGPRPWVDGRKAVERYTAGGRRWWILSTANWIVELAKWVSSTPNFRVCETLAMVLAAPECRFGRYRVCEQTPRRGKADMQHRAFACCSNSCSTIVVFITLHALGFWAAPPCHQPPASEDGSIRMESRSGDGSSPGPPPRLHHRPAPRNHRGSACWPSPIRRLPGSSREPCFAGNPIRQQPADLGLRFGFGGRPRKTWGKPSGR
jgi:hypothetical protein